MIRGRFLGSKHLGRSLPVVSLRGAAVLLIVYERRVGDSNALGIRRRVSDGPLSCRGQGKVVYQPYPVIMHPVRSMWSVIRK